MTGCAESTVSSLIKEVCQAIVKILWEESVTKLFPKREEDFRQTLTNMESEWQFKFVFAATDGSYLPIKFPPGGPEAMKKYHNFKNFYSVVLLALVDAGNTHDSTCFQSTHLFHEINERKILPEKFKFIGNTKIPLMILGDSTFPMKSWMCKPFGDAVMTEKKRYIIYRLSHSRMVSEGAFGKLKSRFRIFHRIYDSSKEFVKSMGLATVVLHNICLEMVDILPRSMDLTVDPATNKGRDREEVAAILDLTDRNQRNYTGDKTATAIRESLETFLGKKNNTKDLNKM